MHPRRKRTIRAFIEPTKCDSGIKKLASSQHQQFARVSVSPKTQKAQGLQPLGLIVRSNRNCAFVLTDQSTADSPRRNRAGRGLCSTGKLLERSAGRQGHQVVLQPPGDRSHNLGLASKASGSYRSSRPDRRIRPVRNFPGRNHLCNRQVRKRRCEGRSSCSLDRSTDHSLSCVPSRDTNNSRCLPQ
jgi:hypothetical protein